MTIIGDGLKVLVAGSIYSKDYIHAQEIAQQVSALLWGLA